MAGPLKTFLCYFTLKQGTVLIAIVQMFISAYILIFYLLGLSHATGMQEMINRDTVDALEREALEDISSRHINSQRMELARHNATEEVYLMYCGLGVTVIHFVTALLLYYGALTSNRHFFTPWMMVMVTIIAALIISLLFEYKITEDCPFMALFSKKTNIFDRLFLLVLANICIYIWLTVYSTYRSLEVKKGVVHEVHSVKAKCPQQVSKDVKKSKSKTTLPSPYNV